MAIGHNSKKARPADVSRAKGYVDRVKALIEQQKELGADISEVCSEAKETAGLEPTFIRYAARESLIDEDKRTERDQKRHQYLHAVGLAVEAVQSGELSARQAAKIYSIGKSSIYKELAVREVSTVEMTAEDLGEWLPAHDAETGELPREMHAGDLGDYLMLVSIEEDRIQGAEIAYEDARGSREMVADDLGDPLWVVDRDRAKFKEKIKGIASKLKPASDFDAFRHSVQTTPDDDCALPAFLDRRVPA